jgi:ParB-like chromosome segregation protein Spo0J
MSEGKFKPEIDEEFQFLIPVLSDEEYMQLDRNIQKDGCTDPIKVWAGHDLILDGHNRYKICDNLGIDYKIHLIELETREEAINWIIDNQLGRRNLTDSQRSYLRGKRYNIEKKPHGGQIPGSIDQSDHSLKTDEKIAQEDKVGSATVRRDAKFAAAVDSLKEDAGHDFGKKLISEEIKLPKTDVIKLANKPADEKKALVDEIQKGAKRLNQAEKALQTGKESQKEIFSRAGAEIEFAGWAWDPKKLEAPKNTRAPQEGAEIKQRLVYLNADIFGDDFTEKETGDIIQAMLEAPQWIFMVCTEDLEQLELIDWPLNVWIGCIVDSDKKGERTLEVFEGIENVTKFVIYDIFDKSSIYFGGLFMFDWVIIRNPHKVGLTWERLEFVVELKITNSLRIYLMPNITIRPREYPKSQEEKMKSQIPKTVDDESV